MAKFIKTTQDTVSAVAITLDGDALAARAHVLAEKVGDEMEGVMEGILQAKEDWQGGPFQVLFTLQGEFEEEILNGFPVPGSEDGNNPDLFSIETEGKDGKKAKKKTTFYAQFSDATPYGKILLSRIECVERAGEKNTVKDDIPREILDMNPAERATELAYLKGRRNTMRGSYKKAMALHFKFNEVGAYAGVEAEPIWIKGRAPKDEHKDGVAVVNSPECIQVWLTPEAGKPPSKWESFSISSFMKLNPAKAEEKGGGWTALMESGVVKKAPQPGAAADKAKADTLTIKTIDTGLTVAVELHRYMTEIFEDKTRAEIGKLYKLVNHKDADELKLTIIELRNMLDDVAKDCNLGTWYTKHLEAESKAA